MSYAEGAVKRDADWSLDLTAQDFDKKFGPLILAAREWSAARRPCLTGVTSAEEYERLARAESALQSAVNHA